MIPTPDQRMAHHQRPDRIPAMRQRWSRLLFAHWKLEPTLIQETLPKGLHVDTFNGDAWIGIVPFNMQRIRPVFTPALPWLSWFLELNVRTYVHDDHGNSGVWFYSLDCNQPVAVEIARRGFHLPYQHARMKAMRAGETVDYHCHRKGRPVGSRYQYRPADSALRVAEPGTLEFFLLERYLLFSTSSTGRIYTGQVHHEPYAFTGAVCDVFDLEPIRQAGFKVADSPARSLLYSPGVDVTVFPLQRSK